MTDPSQEQLRIGVDLGGTKTEAVVVRLTPGATTPDVLARRRVATAPNDPASDGADAARYARILEDTRDLVFAVAREAGLDANALPPVGVGMPGSTTTRAADGSRSPVPLVKNSNSTCLNGRPFHGDLSRAVGQSITFANDANCFALAEAVWGAARDARVSFGVILGTGVGGGVVVRDAFARDGTARAWDGAQSIAGEWGHVALEPMSGPLCYCGRRGCIETLLAGPFLEAAFAERVGEKLSLRDIVQRADRGDGATRAFLGERLDLLGRALSLVVNVLDPDVIVLGGGVSNLAILYRDGPAALAKWTFNDELRTKLVKNELGDSAGVLGAALLPA